MPHALLHMNGFDTAGNVAEEYSGAEYSGSISFQSLFSSVVPPFNGYGRYLFCSSNGYISPALSGAPFTTLCVSGQFSFLDYRLGSSTGETTFIQFWDGLANQVQVEIRASFNTSTNRVDLRAYRGTTLLATSSSPITGGLNQWNWISVLVNVNNSTGVIKIVIGPDNSLVMNFSGNTQNTANTRIDSVRIGRISNTGAATTFFMDDLFITSCLPTDSPLDERRILGAIVPTGNDAVAWTPNTGANWQAVSEIPSNGDTSYNSSNTSGAQDTFATSWPTLTGDTIYAVKITAMARKDDAGTQNLQNVVKVGATSYAGPNKTLLSTYFRHHNVWEQNPSTSLAWVPSDFSSNLKFGYRVA